ncbi:uncharacterized protein MONOS_6729p1 [Monocercomonoides exilis]|uniref:uncharacterized protein n=1 Tax=Monocercomonoides exilis TaxID=2049356 RepID=UPI00355A3AEA|nr:hypothetical protein MONOS_6729p1 [Monocercomonoides exilis]
MQSDMNSALYTQQGEDSFNEQEDFFSPIYLQNFPSSEYDQKDSSQIGSFICSEKGFSSLGSSPDSVIYIDPSPNFLCSATSKSAINAKLAWEIQRPLFFEERLNTTTVRKAGKVVFYIAQCCLLRSSLSSSRKKANIISCRACKTHPLRQICMFLPHTRIILGNPRNSEAMFAHEIYKVLRAFQKDIYIRECELVNGLILFERVGLTHCCCLGKRVDRVWIITVLVVCLLLGYKSCVDRPLPKGTVSDLFLLGIDELRELETVILDYLCWDVSVSISEYVNLLKRVHNENEKEIINEEKQTGNANKVVRTHKRTQKFVEAYGTSPIRASFASMRSKRISSRHGRESASSSSSYYSYSSYSSPSDRDCALLSDVYERRSPFHFVHSPGCVNSSEKDKFSEKNCINGNEECECNDRLRSDRGSFCDKNTQSFLSGKVNSNSISSEKGHLGENCYLNDSPFNSFDEQFETGVKGEKTAKCATDRDRKAGYCLAEPQNLENSCLSGKGKWKLEGKMEGKERAGGKSKGKGKGKDTSNG